MRNTTLVAAVLLAASVSAEELAETALRRAEALLEEGRAGEAIVLFEDGLKRTPADRELRKGAAFAHFVLGRQALEGGDPAGAAQRFQLALGYWQEAYEIYFWLGVAYYRDGNYFAARSEFRHALSRKPADPEILEYVGLAAYREDRLDLAVRYWQEAVASGADEARLDPWLERARKEAGIEREFHRIDGDHFQLRHSAAIAAPTAREVLRELEAAYLEVGRDLSLRPSEAVRVVLYTDEEFRAVTGANQWVGGLFDGKIRLPASAIQGDPDALVRVARHEYTHALLRRVAPGSPAWIEEGLAQLEERGSVGAARSLAREVVPDSGWIPFEELIEPLHASGSQTKVELAYAQSLLLVRHLADRYGLATIIRIARKVGAAVPLEEAFEQETGARFSTLVRNWQSSALDE